MQRAERALNVTSCVCLPLLASPCLDCREGEDQLRVPEGAGRMAQQPAPTEPCAIPAHRGAARIHSCAQVWLCPTVPMVNKLCHNVWPLPSWITDNGTQYWRNRAAEQLAWGLCCYTAWAVTVKSASRQPRAYKSQEQGMPKLELWAHRAKRLVQPQTCLMASAWPHWFFRLSGSHGIAFPNIFFLPGEDKIKLFNTWAVSAGRAVPAALHLCWGKWDIMDKTLSFWWSPGAGLAPAVGNFQDAALFQVHGCSQIWSVVLKTLVLSNSVMLLLLLWPIYCKIRGILLNLITESQNRSRWKGSVRIIKFNSWKIRPCDWEYCPDASWEHLRCTVRHCMRPFWGDGHLKWTPHPTARLFWGDGHLQQTPHPSTEASPLKDQWPTSQHWWAQSSFGVKQPKSWARAWILQPDRGAPAPHVSRALALLLFSSHDGNKGEQKEGQ